jgi:hypothetical protein
MNRIKQLFKVRKLNSSMTNKVIELHNTGYDHDFQLQGQQHVLCLQDNRLFNCDNVLIRLVDQNYDNLSHSFKYLHTIDTGCGQKGILLTGKIATLIGEFKSKEDVS